jgi:hypothetical protein
MKENALEEKVQKLLDLNDINDLITRYSMGFDHRDAKVLGSVFTAEKIAVIMAALETAEKLWQFTQHVITDRSVELRQDDATVRANLIGSNIGRREGEWSGDPFDAAGRAAYEVRGRYEWRVIRTPAGWRIDDTNLTYLWSVGAVPAQT